MQMVDLVGQTKKIYPELQAAIERVLLKGDFINGEEVRLFAEELGHYMEGMSVVPCANGTDALQISLMALGLQAGDEVVVPAFTYVASAEVIALLGLQPVMVDVDERTFNLDSSVLEEAWSPHVKAVIPVHLYGRSADMHGVLNWANAHGVRVIEDNAQSLGALYEMGGSTVKVGTLGDVSCTSFFPTKNLGCFGDGGAMMTRNRELAERLRTIANHGQCEKYRHEVIGCNSRLDTLQAAILRIKLKHLDEYLSARIAAAEYYTAHLSDIEEIITPETKGCTFHQYTLRVLDGQRDALREHLQGAGVPSMVYYPLALCDQPAFRNCGRTVGTLGVSRRLVGEVISLPMHTELTHELQDRVIAGIRSFFRSK